MNFGLAIKTCFSKYTDFSSRASRSEYWNFTLFIIIVVFITDIIDSQIAGVSYWEYYDLYGPASIIFEILIFIPATAVSVRRLHDLNKSGWLILLTITIIGLIPLIYWACKKGDDNGNKFGPSPIHLKKN